MLQRVSHRTTSPRRAPRIQRLAFPRPRPRGGRSLRTTLRPMVPCAPALQLARLLGSFFKLRRRVVARFPELRAEVRLVIWWLWLVRYRRLGRSDPGGEWRCRAGCVGLSGHTSTRQERWAPLAAPVTEPLRAHSAGFCSQALFFRQGSPWRPSRIPPRRRRRRRGRTSRWW